MNWKDEIKKYDKDVWNKPALEKLHRGILEYVETEKPSEMFPFIEILERKSYKILNMIEPKLNKGDD